MEREVFDLLFRQVIRIKWVQRHAVVAHPLRAMPAHFWVSCPGNLAGLLIESVIKC
jgi:hypothetical protein